MDPPTMDKKTYGKIASLAATPPPATGCVRYRDWSFVLLCSCNAIIICRMSSFDATTANDALGLLVALWSLAIGMAAFMLLLKLLFPTTIIVCNLLFNLTVLVGIAVVGLLLSVSNGHVQWTLSIVTAFDVLLTLIYLCYLYTIRRHIPFAAANLKVAAAAVWSLPGLIAVTLCLLCVQLGWTLLWYGRNLFELPRGHYKIIALLGVLVYIDYDESSRASTTRSSPAASLVVGARRLVRTHTCPALAQGPMTSFGSICIGSLVVAIIETLRKKLQVMLQVLRAAGSNGGAARCIICCIAELVEVLNYWAFVYGAVSGTSFVTSGRTVLQLFQTRGLTILLNNNRISSALGFTSIIVGVVILGTFSIGLAVVIVTRGMIESAAAAVIVCFVENPEALQESHGSVAHGSHFRSLRHSWQRMYPPTRP
ncbi:hypothetical protein SPRG_12781 [Saprolegnia parasitica CBS 223.65]|uniref:Choline transporter-like protein n=1 Tax=Saprolegnia parasitica (strain CBS 223.65) TaxID=695850 RepID=A0A067C705_SAPPC|nr:hypothetical protein SPRG_12781 [Saprolegnia parasitica CBS 223.65]KDO22321.1 hypothetical protein SPRG_12781 [Saprolegnia parasitica CBS 223.65]|eukprot:XP_012206955.1 hypothetical protein SPRG_12781 [Saprolegnia parasitica CBS 223.65]